MPALKFSAWMAPGDAAALAAFEAHAGLLTRVYPLWYFSGPQGMPLRRPEDGEESRQSLLALAREHGVEVWPHSAIQAGSDPAVDGGRGLRRVLADGGLRRAHGAALLRLAQEDAVQGVDLDYGTSTGADCAAFSVFVEELCAGFHGAGLKLGVVVRARFGQAGAKGSLGSGDCATLASVCDRLQILGDYPGLGGPGSAGLPGPIAPPDWCAEVLARVATLAPAGKLEWGLPGCGRDWGPEASAADLPWDEWVQRVKAHPPERRDPLTAELTLRHEGREVWTNDAISLTAKLWQVRRHGVAEAALWGLGAEDPRLWALLDSLPKDFL